MGQNFRKENQKNFPVTHELPVFCKIKAVELRIRD